MPGCSIFSFFPRYKAYSQIDSSWDMRGNRAPQRQRMRSPSRPRYPAQSNLGVPQQKRQAGPAYSTPFVPFNVPSVPPPRRSASNTNVYHTFPRSAIVPQVLTPGPYPHWVAAAAAPRMPTPRVVPIQVSSQPHPSHRLHANRHARHHSLTPSAVPSRHVRYVDGRYPSRYRQVSAPTSYAPQITQVFPPPLTSRGLTATVVQPQGQGQRRRAISAGNTSAPVVVNFTPPNPQQRIRANSGHGHQYSRCTGRKKALCIGINYIGQKRQLNGCINDMKNVKRFLTRQWGFRDGDIVTLMDDTKNPRQMPTRRNMIDAMRWLVKDAQPHDSLFFHYSGHGGQIPDTLGEEVNGFDEVIYPVDYKTAGIIVDYDLYDLMVKPLPRGCRLTALFDSCHSGTTLDLPFLYHHDGTLKQSALTARWQSARTTSADVISFAACRDDQTSADTVQGGVAVGAMSYAFLTSLTRKPVQSYLELLLSVRAIVQPNFQQKAQLSSGHVIDTRLRFIL